MAFISNEENGQDVKELFITDSWLVDRFIGNELWTWGYNYSGALGDGTSGTGTNKSSPVQTIAGGTNWKQVACCYRHTIAVKTDGTLWTWGYNSNGQLGDGTSGTGTNKASPVKIGNDTNWKQVAGGSGHTAAIKTDGTLWTWGSNSLSQLGDGSTASKSSPVQTIAGGTNWKQVVCGSNHTTAIKTDWTLWTWGYNSSGQLGDGTTASKSSPVQTIAGGTNWKQVSGGSQHTTAIKTDGTLWTWGDNYYGQLGDGTTASKSSPVQVGTNTNWKQVAGGWGHTAAIKTDGTLWTWGYNIHGQLGDVTTADKSSPVKIGTNTNWKQVACGDNHTAAIKTDGTLWTWGGNFVGELGVGSTADKFSPVQVLGNATNWKQVSGGAIHTAATAYTQY